MTEVPGIYAKIHKILGELGVAKGGVLPSNMGGKPYITAVDLNKEVKDLFVEHKLIIVPSEQIDDSTFIDINNRAYVQLFIAGEYEIIDIEDGSSITIRGTGDGMAIATSVASNIASTNALKNALLRTFLVTEQSSEDAAKTTVDDGEAQPVKSRTASDAERIADAKRKVGAIVNADTNSFDSEKVNAVGDKLTGSAPGKRKWSADDYEKILAEVQRLVDQEAKSGEVAEV